MRDDAANTVTSAGPEPPVLIGEVPGAGIGLLAPLSDR
jgi:hypothetical protein